MDEAMQHYLEAILGWSNVGRGWVAAGMNSERALAKDLKGGD